MDAQLQGQRWYSQAQRSIFQCGLLVPGIYKELTEYLWKGRKEEEEEEREEDKSLFAEI